MLPSRIVIMSDAKALTLGKYELKSNLVYFFLYRVQKAGEQPGGCETISCLVVIPPPARDSES